MIDTKLLIIRSGRQDFMKWIYYTRDKYYIFFSSFVCLYRDRSMMSSLRYYLVYILLSLIFVGDNQMYLFKWQCGVLGLEVP